MRSVVVLPQPDGPSMTKNSPSATVKFESATATNSPKALWRFSTRISAIAVNPRNADDDEHRRADQDGDERPAVERQRERLHQHDDAGGDDHGRGVLPWPAAEVARGGVDLVLRERPLIHRGVRRDRQLVGDPLLGRVHGGVDRIGADGTVGHAWFPTHEPNQPVMPAKAGTQ